MTRELDCHISFQEIGGEVEISERGKQTGEGIWPSIKLVESDESNVHLYARNSSEGVEISMSAYHVENEETNRAFHTNLEVTLNRQELASLHDFLGLLLKWQGEP